MKWLFLIVVGMSQSDLRVVEVSEHQCRALAASALFVAGRAACLSPAGEWIPAPLK